MCFPLASFSIKVVWIRRLNDSSSHTEIVYYVQKDQQPVRAITVVNLLHNYDIQELAVALSQVIHIQAEGTLSMYHNLLNFAEFS